MKRTSLYLLVTVFWLLALRTVLQAQPQQHIDHVTTMHQHIVQQAWELLQREAPGVAMRLDEHIGLQETGSGPWELQTIMAGTVREDLEDIVYGCGGPQRQLWPKIRINRPGNCIGDVYDEFEAQFTGAPEIGEGLVTVTHFWDPAAGNNTIAKKDIRVDATASVSCLTTSHQHVYIDAPANAWEKVQKLFRPGGAALRNYWWTEHDPMYDQHQHQLFLLPVRQQAADCILMKYNTLVELYNTGVCALQLPGESHWRPVVLTSDQKNRFVWEIFGRVCHLLADMSVPAHTHKDMHMGNLSVTKDAEKWGIPLGTVTITVADEDSYETWIGNRINAWWTAQRIPEGLLDLSNVSDPLYFLMTTVRNRTASYASDDADGTGTLRGQPRYTWEIPQRHNLPSGQATIIKQAMMCSIRDNTLPYVIRATATLMAWFASQLQMETNFMVRNVGATGYIDFFQRDDFTDPFPVRGTLSGTSFSNSVGDELSLRSHFATHPLTKSKFRYWKDNKHGTTYQHQFDEYVAEAQGTVDGKYEYAENHTVPILSSLDELGEPLHNVYPTFRNPWHVNPTATNEWDVHQDDSFRAYEPVASMAANGGVFTNIYDVLKPEEGYYSIRASHCLDRSTLDSKSGGPALGDPVFIDWEHVYSNLLDDPQNSMEPPHEDYPDPEQYDTKIVDFLSPQASVIAHYKAHRLAANSTPPTRINSQRKVAEGGGDVHHAVYESSDRIWYVSSRDGGTSWSGEMLVSDMGGHARRPSIAVAGNAVWTTYIENGEIVLSTLSGNRWQRLYTAPVTMVQEATPVIAVLDEYEGCTVRGKIICVVWEDTDVLRFSVLKGSSVLVDNAVLVRGHRSQLSVDQPRYPSICASRLPVSTSTFQQEFHIAWIESGNIYYCRIGIDRRRVPLHISGWSAGAGAITETVHARTGSIGAMYPARHAPSVAATELGTVHVAFDVVTNGSSIPGIGSKPGGTSATFVLRERACPFSLQPTWNTTATILSTNNPAPGLCSPSIGAQPSGGSKGSKSSSLRIVYNDRPGMINVARIDGMLDIRIHEDGNDASIADWSGTDGFLLDVFSGDAVTPYDWKLLASRNNLTKTATGRLLHQRLIILRNDESVAALGLSDPRLIGSSGEERSLIWNPAHDSLVVGENCTLDEAMRSGAFIPIVGEHLRLELVRSCEPSTVTATEVLLQIRDAASSEVLRVVSLPVEGFASAAGVATQDVDLSAMAGTEVFVTANVRMHREKWSMGIADHFALRSDDAAVELEKTDLSEVSPRPSLKQNHPNPFNPSTSISFTLEAAGELRLSVFDLLGKEVAVLADGHWAAGTHTVTFDGSAQPSGVYVYRLECGDHVSTRTMHLVK